MRKYSKTEFESIRVSSRAREYQRDALLYISMEEIIFKVKLCSVGE